MRPEPRWLLSVAGLLLIALVIADPGRINRSTRLVRVLSRVLLVALAASAILSTTLLIHELVAGEDLAQWATKLLPVGNAPPGPLVPWAMIAMGLQSVISIMILGLVVARAVNVFS